MLTSRDLTKIRELGLSLDAVEAQLETIRNGIPPIPLDRAATIGDGILRLSQDESASYARLYEEKISLPGRALKFVPASGAATRMFRHLESPELISQITKLPFFVQLQAFLRDRDLEADTSGLAKAFLEPSGMGLARQPKGLLPFHRYSQYARTAFEEQLVESEGYVRDCQGSCRLHFTLSEEFLPSVENFFKKILPNYERAGLHYEVSFSVQKKTFNTVAVDLNDQPFRDLKGNLVFRPAGHGALLANLSSLEADVVFIKNIDNVHFDRDKPRHNFFKKVLGGVLAEVQAQLFHLLAGLEQGGSPAVEEAVRYATDPKFRIVDPAEIPSDLQKRRDFLRERLNRPIRVCGMVPNQGEPGGGPFWVQEAGRKTLQIVESAQVDAKSPAQMQILKSSTHFNPVDLVCGLRDYRGSAFDLERFRDPNTGFITLKSEGGWELKALELPGLWNGAMAGWITIFVEVPIETFNPVKTIHDLLRKSHQP